MTDRELTSSDSKLSDSETKDDFDYENEIRVLESNDTKLLSKCFEVLTTEATVELPPEPVSEKEFQEFTTQLKRQLNYTTFIWPCSKPNNNIPNNNKTMSDNVEDIGNAIEESLSIPIKEKIVEDRLNEIPGPSPTVKENLKKEEDTRIPMLGTMLDRQNNSFENAKDTIKFVSDIPSINEFSSIIFESNQEINNAIFELTEIKNKMALVSGLTEEINDEAMKKKKMALKLGTESDSTETDKEISTTSSTNEGEQDATVPNPIQ